MVKKNNLLCCKKLQDIIENIDAPIEYEPRTREVVLVVPKQYNNPSETCRMAFTISHCPACGTAFPPPLLETWYDLVEHSYGAQEWPINAEKLSRLPPEFRTDEWWKKRGL